MWKLIRHVLKYYMALFSALKNYAKLHAKAVFFTRAVGGMRWGKQYGDQRWKRLRSGLDRPPEFRLQMDALSTAGWKKISVIYQENPVENASGRQKNCDGDPAQQAAIMGMQEWLRHPCTLNPVYTCKTLQLSRKGSAWCNRDTSYD